MGAGSGTRWRACAATLCGARSYSAMAEWGHVALEVVPGPVASLGLGRHGPPSTSTLHRVFRWLDVGAVERALGGWAQEALAASAPARQLEGVAMDGKTLRGTREGGVPGLHRVPPGCCGGEPPAGADPGPGAGGREDERDPLGHTLLDGLLLGGRVLTMDALLTQRAIARDVVDRGGDYLMVVKDNQPTGYPLGVADIALLFEAPGDDAAARGLRCPSLSTGRGKARLAAASTLPRSRRMPSCRNPRVRRRSTASSTHAWAADREVDGRRTGRSRIEGPSTRSIPGSRGSATSGRKARGGPPQSGPTVSGNRSHTTAGYDSLMLSRRPGTGG